MLLYQPSPNEILAAAVRAKAHNPSLVKRFDKAVEILADVNANFDLDDDAWRVRSQSDPGSWHVVGSAGCSCDDYRVNAAKGRYFCKHLLAYYGYRRMLGNALNRRLVGDLKFHSERLRARAWPGSLLAVTDGKRPRVVAYSEQYRYPRHVCFLRLDASERLVPSKDEDYQAFAEWLTSAPDFETEQEAPRMEDFTPDRMPEWSQGDFRHWVATGDVPAMRLNF